MLLSRHLLTFVLAISFVLVSCQEENISPEENVIAQEENAVPLEDINTTLENWDQEVEYMELTEDGENSRRRWRRFRPTFFTLTVALLKEDLLGTIIREDLTVFAPTDRAFAKLGIFPWNVGRVENLTEILLYHVTPGRVFAKDLSHCFEPTLNGAEVRVTINESQVIKADIHALNGVIHIIDKVLIPPTANIVQTAQSFAPEFESLVGAVVAAGLDETLATGGPFTVFAPTNQAFADLGVDPATLTVSQLQQILLYHVVEGRVFSCDLTNGPVTTLNGDVTIDAGNLTLDDLGSPDVANLIPTLLDVQATNGVIHVIDKVLIPEGFSL